MGLDLNPFASASIGQVHRGLVHVDPLFGTQRNRSILSEDAQTLLSQLRKTQSTLSLWNDLSKEQLTLLGLHKVAVKIQFPGVENSIDSDLNNLKMLLVANNLLPKGLFIKDLIKGVREDLKQECN